MAFIPLAYTVYWWVYHNIDFMTLDDFVIEVRYFQSKIVTLQRNNEIAWSEIEHYSAANKSRLMKSAWMPYFHHFSPIIDALLALLGAPTRHAGHIIRCRAAMRCHASYHAAHDVVKCFDGRLMTLMILLHAYASPIKRGFAISATSRIWRWHQCFKSHGYYDIDNILRSGYSALFPWYMI